MNVLEIYHYIQTFNTVAAVLLNVFLVVLVIYNSHNKMGKYRYLIITFACFEATYALVVYIGMPINFVADRSWMVFTYAGLLGGTPLAVLGPGLYCTFYETWMAFVVVHFLYRYIVVCRPNLAGKITYTLWAKLCCVFLWLMVLLYTCLCGLFFCTRLEMSSHMANLVRESFDIDDPYSIGYILLRKRDPGDDSFSFVGTTTLVNHFLLVAISAAIIFYCGIQVWKAILRMREEAYFLREVKVQRQMFITLVIQTLVPVIFCHIPTLIYLTFPFWETDLSFGAWSLVFCLMTSISKWIDPIIVIVCIKEYRRAAFSCLSGKTFRIVTHTSSNDGPENVSHVFHVSHP